MTYSWSLFQALRRMRLFHMVRVHHLGHYTELEENIHVDGSSFQVHRTLSILTMGTSGTIHHYQPNTLYPLTKSKNKIASLATTKMLSSEMIVTLPPPLPAPFTTRGALRGLKVWSLFTTSNQN